MINFYLTRSLKRTEDFYTELGLTVYMRQANCIIFQADEGQLGFVDSPHCVPPTYSCISFTKDTIEEIDALYEQYKQYAVTTPQEHPTAPIYSFFMKDPNGLSVEFQVFIQRYTYEALFRDESCGRKGNKVP